MRSRIMFAFPLLLFGSQPCLVLQLDIADVQEVFVEVDDQTYWSTTNSDQREFVLHVGHPQPSEAIVYVGFRLVSEHELWGSTTLLFDPKACCRLRSGETSGTWCCWRWFEPRERWSGQLWVEEKIQISTHGFSSLLDAYRNEYACGKPNYRPDWSSCHTHCSCNADLKCVLIGGFYSCPSDGNFFHSIHISCQFFVR